MSLEYQWNVTWIPMECHLNTNGTALTAKGMPIDCQWSVTQMSLECQWNGHRMPIECQLNASWLPIECHWTTTGMSIEGRWNANWLQMECQLTANPVSLNCHWNSNWLSMKCQLSANGMPIGFNSKPGPRSFPSIEGNTRGPCPWVEFPQCQSCQWTVDWPILCHLNQSSANEDECHSIGPSLYSTASTQGQGPRSFPSIEGNTRGPCPWDEFSQWQASQWTAKLPMNCQWTYPDPLEPIQCQSRGESFHGTHSL